MSDLSAVLLMLAVFLGGAVCSHLFFKRIHQLCDCIETGVVEGRPVSLRYRSLRLYYDYLTNGFAASFVLLVLAAGFFTAAGLVGDSNARTVAYFCSAVSAASAVANVVFVAGWVVYLRSMLRQAEAD
jgi:hypothetical protein